ncbi:MAG TPA: hypothetical protein GX405_12255, partial [Rhizobiales bacterium]|nr:hypothetical protein [Hyphomicrobiales bacterium]
VPAQAGPVAVSAAAVPARAAAAAAPTRFAEAAPVPDDPGVDPDQAAPAERRFKLF